jgi:hypothetical protein
MEQGMRDTGKRTNSMGRDLRLGLMVQATKVLISMVKNMGKDDSLGQMDPLTKVNLLTTILKVKAFITGVINELTQVIGKTTRWRV